MEHFDCGSIETLEIIGHRLSFHFPFYMGHYEKIFSKLTNLKRLNISLAEPLHANSLNDLKGKSLDKLEILLPNEASQSRRYISQQQLS